MNYLNCFIMKHIRNLMGGTSEDNIDAPPLIFVPIIKPYKLEIVFFFIVLVPASNHPFDSLDST